MGTLFSTIMFRNTIKSCRFILSSSTTHACSSTRASTRVFRCSFANKPATAAKLKAQMRPAFQELGEEALPNEKPSESIMKKAISPFAAEKFPFHLLFGKARDLKKNKVELDKPETWRKDANKQDICAVIVTQKRVFSSLLVDSWIVNFKKMNVWNAYPVYEIVLIDEFLWRIFGFLLEAQTRKSVKPGRHDKVFYRYHALDETLIQTLGGLKSQVKPYVFILDKHDRIRWRAEGGCSDEEAQLLPGIVTSIEADQNH